VDLLRTQVRGTLDLLRSLPESKGDHRYAPGKWSIKQVVGHVIDGERVFSYRALRFGRGDATELPGFEQDDYARDGGFEARTLRHLTDELESVRRATVLLFEGFGEEHWLRKGIASENPVSVRALAYIIAGHEHHHVRVLREKYLV
jgi:DinB family protein